MSTLPSPSPADLAASDDRTLAPGSLQRVRQMAALRVDGWSLDEIAVRFGVSRERVRQILRAQGGGPGPQPSSSRGGDGSRRTPRVASTSSVTTRLVAQRELSEQAQTRVHAVHAALPSA